MAEQAEFFSVWQLSAFVVFGSLFSTLILATLLYFGRDLMRPVRRVLGLHVWSYRNPHDRTCDGCGRHQVEHARHYTDTRGWWETFQEGNGNLLRCSTKKSVMGRQA